MPVESLREIHAGRDFDTDADVKRYTRVFLCRTTHRHDEGFVVQQFTQASGIGYGATHHQDANASVVSIRGVNSNGPFFWTITVGYSTETKENDNPLEDPIEYSWEDVYRSELTMHYVEMVTNPPQLATGEQRVMTNSAGDAFDKAVNVEVGVKAVNFTLNIDAEKDTPSWVFDLPSDPDIGRQSVNDTDIQIDGRSYRLHQCKFVRASLSTVKTRNDIPYREVSCRILTNQRGWQIRRLDEGFRFNEGGTLTPIRENIGTLPSKPAPLNGAGGVLASPSASDLVLLDFLLYPARDFTQVPGITTP